MSSPTRFRGNFTQQEPLPAEAIAAALAVLHSGRLHRYNTIDGEVAETVRLEEQFRDWTGARYCLAVTSGGYALQTCLRASGVGPGDAVLTNAFTLSPVPGAIVGAGGRPVLVEVTGDLVIDLDDLQRKSRESGARTLLLSHMRGHLCDMDRLMQVADACGLRVIEDCAHTMGAAWRGVPSGRHGLAGCFSTQTYKHANSGEGGFIVSDDAALMARATVLSGSYMLYETHTAGPPAEVFADIRLDTPNCSGRMDNLRAAILRPQIARLDERRQRWNLLYRIIEQGLRAEPAFALPTRAPEESFVGSSIQFWLRGSGEPGIHDFLSRTAECGVALKWFGSPVPIAYTSRHDSWRYLGNQSLPQTDAVLAELLDMRIPLAFSERDCRQLAGILCECARATREAAATGSLRSVEPARLGAV